MHSDLASYTYGVEFEVILPAEIQGHSEAAARVSEISSIAVVTAQRLGSFRSARPIAAGTAWKVVHDGSVLTRNRGETGAEFVSPVLKGEEGLEQIRKICAAFAALNIQVNPSCGFHVHVAGFQPELHFFKNLVKLANRFEGVLDSLHPASRRAAANRYCRPVNQTTIGALDAARNLDAIIFAQTGLDAHDPSRRYFKLNLAAYRKHSTVEFRQHAGTTNAEKAIAWIGTCIRMVRAAEAGKTGEGAAAAIASFAHLDAKARRVAEMVSQPSGATRAEIIAGTDWRALSVNRQARIAGIALRIVRERGAERFFRDVTTAATVTVDLNGLAALLEADESEIAFLNARRAAVAA